MKVLISKRLLSKLMSIQKDMIPISKLETDDVHARRSVGNLRLVLALTLGAQTPSV
jgi:hypothetical protein